MALQDKPTIPTSLPEFAPLTATSDISDSKQYMFFRLLSEQVGQWSLYNFGAQLPHRPGMGMLEELAELQEGFSEYNREAVIDAVGDIVIYMADYYSKREWNMGTAWSSAARPTWLQGRREFTSIATILTKKLAHHHLKGEQGIRGGSDVHTELMKETCQATLWYLDKVCLFFNVDLLEIVSTVWYGVSKRDWKKNKDKAHEVAAKVETPTSDLSEEED